MSEVTTLYLHGIGNNQLRRGEAALLERHRRKGMTVVTPMIDWESRETFSALFNRITHKAEELLEDMGSKEMLLLEGSSAGGSLAVSVLKRLNDSRVRAITHSSRLRSGDLRRRDPRSLERCAHLWTDRASQSFYDSVLYCESATIPSLTQAERNNIITTKQLADEAVPVSTMTIEGVQSVTLPVISHRLGIGLGMLVTPSLIERIT